MHERERANNASSVRALNPVSLYHQRRSCAVLSCNFQREGLQLRGSFIISLARECFIKGTSVNSGLFCYYVHYFPPITFIPFLRATRNFTARCFSLSHSPSPKSSISLSSRKSTNFSFLFRLKFLYGAKEPCTFKVKRDSKTKLALSSNRCISFEPFHWKR